MQTEKHCIIATTRFLTPDLSYMSYSVNQLNQESGWTEYQVSGNLIRIHLAVPISKSDIMEYEVHVEKHIRLRPRRAKFCRLTLFDSPRVTEFFTSVNANYDCGWVI